MAKRILIVDDEENIREMTRLTLETAGYEVVEAASGLEAFAIIGGDESQVELVIHDLPIGKAFWTEQAERFLTDFIWNDGTVPTNGRLTLKGMEREAWERAARKELSNEQAHSNHRR